jgi:hypothetical protein
VIFRSNVPPSPHEAVAAWAMASFNSAAFPAPTVHQLPHPSSSSAGEQGIDTHHSSSEQRSLKPKRSRRNILRANKFHPLTPSLLTASFDDGSTSSGPSLHVSSRVERIGHGVDVEQWMNGSESEELEMDSYHGGASGDEEVGVSASDRRKAKQIRHGIRHRAGDESEEALIHGEDPDDEVTKEEKKEADGKVLRDLAINLILIGLWYASPSWPQISRTYNGWSLGISSRC